MERRVKNCLGVWAREELLASERAVSVCLACMESGWVRGWDTARGPHKVFVVTPANFLQDIDHRLSTQLFLSQTYRLRVSFRVFMLGGVLILL